MPIDIKNLKKKLEEEKSLLIEELKSLGRKDAKSGDWEAEPIMEDIATQEPDEGDRAEHFEDFEERSAELNVLESRLKEIESALRRMGDGTYGKCRVCGKDIEEDRLTANPAADTCKAHME